MSQNTDFIPFFYPTIGKEEEEAVLRVMRSGWLTTGKEALSFEKEFSSFVNSKHALAVNSNTSGLILAMEACGLNNESKILTTPYTFVATASAARHLGANVEYADIEEDSYNISPMQIEQKLKNDKSIKAIVPVHIGGNICKMDEINALAKKYNVKVIEDAAHAFPAKNKSGYAGTFGDIGVFSFYATKTITTGEGGMITTNNDELANRMNTMRLHGISRDVWDRYTSKNASWEYDVVDAGFKFNMPDILAAIGREQLKKANALFESRKQIAHTYNEAFKNLDFLQIPPDEEGNAWHLYMIQLNLEKLTVNRNEFSALLQENGLGVSMHFIPHFRMSYFKKLYNLKAEDFPNAQKRFERSISLPFWPGMQDWQVQKVIETVTKIGKAHYGN